MCENVPNNIITILFNISPRGYPNHRNNRCPDDRIMLTVTRNIYGSIKYNDFKRKNACTFWSFVARGWRKSGCILLRLINWSINMAGTFGTKKKIWNLLSVLARNDIIYNPTYNNDNVILYSTLCIKLRIKLLLLLLL